MTQHALSETADSSVYHIPGKAAVFQALVSGMHISLSSGELYHYLQQHHDDYINEFKTLGYHLIHEQDYYYFQGQIDSKANDFSRRCLVFISIMLESLSHHSHDLVQAFFDTHGFERDRLPHFSSERYRNYLQHLDIHDEKQLSILLKHMQRAGFIAYSDTDNTLRFLSPCSRFLHLSLDVLQQHQQTKKEANQ